MEKYRMTSTPDERKKIWTLIKDARVAMLTSEDQGRMRSRPMVASQKNFDDGCLWFFTRSDSPKAEQVAREHQVNAAYASASDNSFVSLSGAASLVFDRGDIDAHWNEMVKAWFADGKDDPHLALLKVNVDQAQYWDAPGSRMVVAFDYLKARITGKPPELGENKKVDLR
jgi:general stress protein 26